jgi:ribosomal protein S6--L-glutamate ligase
MSNGIHALTCADELEQESAHELRAALVDADGQPRPLLAQHEVSSSGDDLKVYVVGDWVRAIRRPFPAETEAEKRGRRVDVPAPIREAALACGRALGLELYGVDFLTSGDRFWVVDVNGFPSYRGIDGAVERIGALLLAGAQSG